ncbi:MAG: hypothetical protein WDM90_12860 [Ferruginibacter sp.]
MTGYRKFRVTSNGILHRSFLFKQNEHVNHSLNFQLSNTNNVPRYDRLQDTKNFGGAIGTALRYAEWFYGHKKESWEHISWM